MKRTIILFIALAVVSILAWFTVKLIDTSGTSHSELIQFGIEDTTAIDKIIITDPLSNRMELIKESGHWTDSEGGCITVENVQLVLDAIKNIEFKSYVSENGKKQLLKIMTVQHIKVEIFQHGEWTKTWYIGPSAQDHYGQVMLLDDSEFGKSDLPVVMTIKGEHGIIEPRFFADPRKWMCTNIFSVPIQQISSVEVTHVDQPSLSFKVTKSGNDMNVYQQGKKLENVDESMLFRYLHNYKKIHYDLANYELDEKQAAALKKTSPFAVLTLRQLTGKTTKLRMFRIPSEESIESEFGTIANSDQDKFWCELPNGQLVKCQYFVFDPLLKGHIYFPMDLSKVKRSTAPKTADNN